MPDIMTARRLAPETASIVWAEFQCPPADHLIRDEDSTLEQHLDRLTANDKSG
jgi:hypothetical protein